MSIVTRSDFYGTEPRIITREKRTYSDVRKATRKVKRAYRAYCIARAKDHRSASRLIYRTTRTVETWEDEVKNVTTKKVTIYKAAIAFLRGKGGLLSYKAWCRKNHPAVLARKTHGGGSQYRPSYRSVRALERTLTRVVRGV